MTFRSDSTSISRWVEAFGLSLGLHTALAAIVVLWLNDPFLGASLPAPPSITIATLIVQEHELSATPIAPLPSSEPDISESGLSDDPGTDSGGDNILENGILESPALRNPEAERLSAITPPAETLSPIRPDPDAAVATLPDPVSPTQGDVLAPLNGEGQTSSPSTTPSPDPGDFVDPEYLDLATRIRENARPPCLAALPRRATDGTLELRLMGPDAVAMERLATSILSDFAATTNRSNNLLDQAQCAAVNFMQTHAHYPALRLSIGLSSQQIASGSNVSGLVRGAGGRYLTLLLVDDNGVVQNLGRFMSLAGSAARFDVPVERLGAPRDTQLLLVAVASSGRPLTSESMNGRLADDFFPSLSRELGNGTSIGIATFSVN